MTYRGKTLTALAALLALLLGTAQPVLAASSDPVPGFDGTVLAIAYSGTTVYVGGDFQNALVNGKRVPRSRLAAINAVTGELLPWAPAADARVKALAVSGSSVFVAGDFARVGGQKRDSLARLDAGTGAVAGTFKVAITGRPYAMAVDAGRLYLGGAFTAIGSQTRTRLAAFKLSTGALDSKWKPAVDDQVEAITAAGGRVYVGGRFHKVNNTGGYSRLVALDRSKGTVVTGFKPKATVITYGITATADGVFSAHGGLGGKLNAYTLSGAPRWTATFDGDTQAAVVRNGVVYVGGHFDRACRTANTGAQGACLDGSDDRVKLAALDSTTGVLQPWTANANGIVGVLAMAADAGLGRFAAGGAFTTVDGAGQKRFAQFG